VGQHLVHGVLVEQPLVDRLGLDPVRDAAVLVPFERVPLVLLVLGQVVVAMPSRWNLSGTDTAFGGTRKPSRTASSSE
jgi:hypothetical protein